MTTTTRLHDNDLGPRDNNLHDLDVPFMDDGPAQTPAEIFTPNGNTKFFPTLGTTIAATKTTPSTPATTPPPTATTTTTTVKAITPSTMKDTEKQPTPDCAASTVNKNQNDATKVLDGVSIVVTSPANSDDIMSGVTEPKPQQPQRRVGMVESPLKILMDKENGAEGKQGHPPQDTAGKKFHSENDVNVTSPADSLDVTSRVRFNSDVKRDAADPETTPAGMLRSPELSDLHKSPRASSENLGDKSSSLSSYSDDTDDDYNDDEDSMPLLQIIEDGEKASSPATSLADDDVENGNVKTAHGGVRKGKGPSEPRQEGSPKAQQSGSSPSLRSNEASLPSEAEPGASFFKENEKQPRDETHVYHSSLLKLVGPDAKAIVPSITLAAAEDEDKTEDKHENEAEEKRKRKKYTGGDAIERDDTEDAEDTFSLKLPQRKDRMRHASQPNPVNRPGLKNVHSAHSAQTLPAKTRRISAPARPGPLKSSLRRTRSREEGEGGEDPHEPKRLVFKPSFSLPVLTFSENGTEIGAADPTPGKRSGVMTSTSWHEDPHHSASAHEDVQGAGFAL